MYQMGSTFQPIVDRDSLSACSAGSVLRWAGVSRKTRVSLVSSSTKDLVSDSDHPERVREAIHRSGFLDEPDIDQSEGRG